MTTIFPDSKLAHQYLDGLTGIEIGAALHNPFNLNTINADLKLGEIYEKEQVALAEGISPIDVIIQDASRLPFKDKEYDFVINSHVIEHIYRPDLAIIEWCRVAKSYIFLIIPHKDRTFDKDRNETTPEEIFSRENLMEYPDGHHNVWRTQSFLEFIFCLKEYVEILEVQNVDDKVGNGFTVVLKIKS